MTYFHVYVCHIDNSERQNEANELDLSEEELKTRIVEPFLAGQDFICGGQPVNPFRVKEIKISQSEEPSDDIIPRLDREIYSTIEAYGVVVNSLNVTKKFIIHPPKKEAKSEIKETVKNEMNKDIFIVHGTDFTPVAELKTIIKESGLNPIVLREQPSKGMTLIEKLEKYSNVGFAFITLTPDDIGVGKMEVRKLFASVLGKENYAMDDFFKWAEDNSEAAATAIKKMFEMYKDRARQNVVLEFGYFIGKLSREKICCLYKGNIELPSDMHGVCYVHFDNSINEVKGMILKELTEAGYEVKLP